VDADPAGALPGHLHPADCARVMTEDRSTAELVILTFAGTACAALVLATLGIGLAAAIHPDSLNLGDSVRTLADLVATMVGAVLGFLAGASRAGGERGSHQASAADSSATDSS
jgi:hypothetical protein